MKTYCVYIMASKLRVLYVGVTSKLEVRVWDHKRMKVRGFTQKYHCDSLVYYETFGQVRAAIAREKQIKSWRREKKLNLVERMNPEWKNLGEGWYPVIPALQEPNP